ncbi:CDP-glycerol glycerophosphotransferase family protein [Parasutterella secunda]|uniref:CDP-glycerol glycerophosphotransferase family protein n=1 Tax=Parasutterella secunda TaxID=626947 RepID=UPI0025A43F64|nr:CDP-glycerol glycerophosphotransferase family protein [Parasutterella secunda]MDM8218956.1 CDP-glycerol glycerophosphotransferase family protein [Parasutterella secunda]
MKLLIKTYLFLSLTTCPLVACAYLDPGSGNALIYLLFSLAGAVIYFIKSSFYKFLGLFNKNYSKETKTKTDPSNIVIFSEDKSYWLTYKPIVQEFIKRQINFAYLSMDVEDPGLTIDNPFMHSKYVGKGNSGFAKIASCRAKVMLSTTPNIGTPGYPLTRPRNVKTLAYIYHAVADTSYLKIGALDNYDASLNVGKWVEPRIRQIEQIRNIKNKECVAVGLPYLDVLGQQVAQRQKTNLGQTTVLFAPSWGEKNCLNVYGIDFLLNLVESDYQVIIRPHPQSIKFDTKLYDDLKKKLINHHNVTFDYKIDASESMRRADILISDASSFRFDFAFLYKKPVLTIDVPLGNLATYEASLLGGPWDQDLGVRLGEVYSPAQNESICTVVNRLINRKDMASEIQKLFNEIVAFHGHSAEKIVNWVNNKLIETK